MARSSRYKLIVAANGRNRQDGYAPANPPTSPTEHLFDLQDDPGEINDLIGHPGLAPVADRLPAPAPRPAPLDPRAPDSRPVRLD